jgi:cyanide hydratase
MAPNVTKKYKAAAVNAEPGWLDLELSVEKTIHWINEAGKNGCKLVAFPELCKSTRARSPFPFLHRQWCWLASLHCLTQVFTFADCKYRDSW